MMTRVATIVVLATTVSLGPTITFAQASKPNVVFILADKTLHEDRQVSERVVRRNIAQLVAIVQFQQKVK